MANDRSEYPASDSGGDPGASSLSALLGESLSWAQRAVTHGWVDAAQLSRMTALSSGLSADLFDATDQSPLVVALFGGTGVGKSSLLNALAGKEIAKVGVIRPTSLEATVYVHDAVHFNAPQRFQRAAHTDEARRHLVWVDMPDIDSTATANRELVLEFLPYVDLLVYVVSPERYRDEAPWALLREHVATTAWVFVMNQVDRGTQVQFDDLHTVLGDAGFADPVVLRTSAVPTADGVVAEVPNELDKLRAYIDELSETRLRHVLQDQARQARFDQLTGTIAELTHDWPADASLVQQAWDRGRARLREELTHDLVARLAPVAARMVDAGPVAEGELWDQWSHERFTDAVTQTALDAAAAGWPVAALEPLHTLGVTELAEQADGVIRRCVRHSLARPGSALQRGMHASFEKLTYLLPLAALGWVGWHVLDGFYRGTQGSGGFVGEGFAVNASLLVILAGLVPYLLARFTKPSPKRAALRGVEAGLAELLELLDVEATRVIAGLAQELTGLREECAGIMRHAAASSKSGEPQGDSGAQQMTQRLRSQVSGRSA